MLRLGLWVALAGLLLDHLTKWWAIEVLSHKVVIIIPGMFDFILMHNKGAAFSLFVNLPSPWREGMLITIAVVASGGMIWLLRQVTDRLNAVGLGLVLSGAVGNVIDRIFRGAVVDFIHVHWHNFDWPVFNIADCAITVGIGLMMWDAFVQARDSKHVKEELTS
ncbi:MAG: signal peptidase II [Magnetococcales bacterium]|nr:signal peptidase II [Magnetococcales bacterium]